MLTTAARTRLTVVLVGARNPSNIGAAARALQDFGFSDLRIVNDFAAPFEAAQLEVKSAVAAQHVMHSARRFNHLADAIADCTLVVATTAIGEREIKHRILPLQQAAAVILSTLCAPPTAVSSTTQLSAQLPPSALDRVALLFGSEKTGLTNDQLSHCSLLTTIPMFSPSANTGDDTRHLSMNLGQSVAVCLYELTRSGFEASVELPIAHEAACTAQDRELLTHLLLDVLEATGYTRRFPANSSELLVRQLIQQLAAARAEPLSHRQAMTWMGILRQILWRERNNPAIHS
jgi:TrmH family RNA methyltransferase